MITATAENVLQLCYDVTRTFSITSDNFHFISTYGILTVLEVYFIENKRPHVVTESISVQSTLSSSSSSLIMAKGSTERYKT